MNVSPYAAPVAKLQQDLLASFRASLGLSLNGYSHEDISPGDRVGILKFSDRRQGRRANVVTGYEEVRLEFSALVSLGTETHAELIDAIAQMSENADHWFGLALEQVDSELPIRSLERQDTISSSDRQSVRPPHYWMSDIVFGGVLIYFVYKDERGKHIWHRE